MRLSWYADTGVAVFSIWQGGTCTGTFRLAIADLPRMVEALQRGPHGDARSPRDARGAAEQHGRTGQRGGQPLEPGPEPDTGYSDPGFTAAYAGHPAAYGAEPPRDYLDQPGRGHRGEPATAAYREDQSGEYRRTGAHGRYEDDARRAHRDDSPPGGYRGEPGSGHPAPGGYEDEPTGVYRGDPLSRGYRDEPAARHREADYPDDPLTGRYPAEDPHPPRYPEGDPHPPRYQDDPLTGPYHEDPHPSRYPQDPLTGDYPDGPDTGDYPAGQPAAGYPGDSAAYPEDTAGYPDDDASRDYPASSGNAGYSPARPYVAPVPGGSGPAEGRGHGRRRPAGREEDDPSPVSFPYGQPPAEPGPRRRGR